MKEVKERKRDLDQMEAFNYFFFFIFELFTFLF
jgi:hypothetical protein